MHHILARVRALLGGERARVPAREAGGLGDAHPQQLREQRLIRRLRPEPRETGRDLRVEHVSHLGAEAAAHERHVLAPGVHHDLDAGVGQHRRQGSCREALLERIQELDPLGHAGDLRGGELHEAQQGAVTALAHELRVQREPARRPRPLGELPQGAIARLGAHVAARGAHAEAPGSSHSNPRRASPAWRETSVPCARTQRAGAAQAGFTAAPRRPQEVFRNA